MGFVMVCVKMGAYPKVAMEKTYDWTHMRPILILKIYENGNGPWI
jgi:hypothetical protein